MPDFSQLLRRPAGQAKPPQPLEANTYPGIIKGHEVGESSKNKTPYVRFNLGLTGWPDGVEPQEGVDISKKSMRRDFYLTEDAMYRLDQFIASCGVQAEGRSYEEVLPEMHGLPVLVEVQQYTTDRSGTLEVGNQVNGLTGA